MAPRLPHAAVHCAALMFLCVGGLAAAAPQGPKPLSLRALEEEIRLTASKPEGVGALHSLQLALPFVDARGVDEALAALVSSPRAHPTVRARAAWLSSRLLLERGEVEAARRASQELGIVSAWSLAPAEALSDRTCAEVEGPTEPFFPLSSGPADGRIPFSEILWAPSASAGFAATRFTLPRSDQVHVYWGAQFDATLWIDGVPIGESHGTERAELDQFGASVRLPAGEHELRIRVCPEVGAEADDTEWGFIVRLTSSTGSPIGTRAEQQDPGGPSARPGAGRVQSKPRGTALSQIVSSKRAPRSPTAAIRRARALAALGWRDEAPWLGDSPEERFVRAEREAQPHRAQELVLSVAREDPTHVGALVFLAERAIAQQRYFRARHWIEALEAIAEGAPRTVALRAQLLADNESPGAAAAALDDALGVFSRVPGLVYERAVLAFDAGEYELANERMSELATIAPLDYPVASWRLEIDLARQRTDSPLEWARLLSEGRIPFGPRQLRRARVELDYERSDLADRTIEAMGPLLFYDPGTLRRVAELKLQSGKASAAVQLVRKALALRPQDSEARRLYKYLVPNQEGFEAKFRQDPMDLEVAYPPAASPPDTEFLLDNRVVRVYPNGLATAWQQRVLRVNATDFDDERRLSLTYDAYTESVEIETAAIVTPAGEVRPISQREETILSEEWYGLYYDQRRLTIVFEDLEPGDLIVAEYRINDLEDSRSVDRFGDIFFLADVAPKREVSYTLLVPPEVEIDAALVDPLGQAAVQEAADQFGRLEVRSWNVRDVPALGSEERMPGISEVAAYIHASAFSGYDDVAGHYGQLIRSQATSNDAIRAHVAEVTAGIDDKLEQIRALHSDLVKTFRYVGLEFGIHGYQPYSCPLVFARKFGDCKDQSTLLQVMLTEIGVESTVAILRTRPLGRVPMTPASLAVFDHAIIYVEAFDLWIDPTATWHAIGELPHQAQGATALLVGAANAPIVTTPTDQPSANESWRELRVSLREDGSAQLRGELRIQGLFAPEIREGYREVSLREQKLEEALQVSFPGFRLESARFDGLEDLGRQPALWVEGVAPAVTDADDGRLALARLWAPEYSDAYPSVGARNYDVVLDYPFVDRRVLRVEPPAGYEPSKELPPTERLENPHGTAIISYSVEGRELVREVELQVSAVRIRAAHYAEWRRFLRRIEERARAQITFVKTGADT